MAQIASLTSSRDVVLKLISALNAEGKTAAVARRFSRAEDLNRKVAEYGRDYPEFDVVPLDVLADGELVAVRFTLERRSLSFSGGPLPGPGGRCDGMEAIATCRVEDGKIAQWSLDVDVLGQVLAQRGRREETGAPTLSGLPRVPEARAGTGRAQTAATRELVTGYLAAVSGKCKTRRLLERFVSDARLVAQVLELEAAFPRFELAPQIVVAAGDRVAVRFLARMRHLGAFLTLPATGLDLVTTASAVFRVKSGRIAEHWLQLDRWSLLQAVQGSELPQRAPNGRFNGRFRGRTLRAWLPGRRSPL